MLGSFAKENRPRTPLDRRRSLAAIPTRSPQVEERPRETGVELFACFERQRGPLSRWLPPTIQKRVELDELGAFVFSLIDGKNTVETIIDRFRETYRVNRREAELSVVGFLRSLAERRMIAIIVD